jgi:hypothetical protein
MLQLRKKNLALCVFKFDFSIYKRWTSDFELLFLLDVNMLQKKFRFSISIFDSLFFSVDPSI